MKDIVDIDKIMVNPNFVTSPLTMSSVTAMLRSSPTPSPRSKGCSSRRASRSALCASWNAQGLPHRHSAPLNTYTYAPLFNAYFASLGLKSENTAHSDYTTPELYRAGSSRGAIDPCYPLAARVPTLYNLLATKHAKKPLQRYLVPPCMTCCIRTW